LFYAVSAHFPSISRSWGRVDRMAYPPSNLICKVFSGDRNGVASTTLVNLNGSGNSWYSMALSFSGRMMRSSASSGWQSLVGLIFMRFSSRSKNTSLSNRADCNPPKNQNLFLYTNTAVDIFPFVFDDCGNGFICSIVRGVFMHTSLSGVILPRCAIIATLCPRDKY
jgi:hypothetical protein